MQPAVQVADVLNLLEARSHLVVNATLLSEGLSVGHDVPECDLGLAGHVTELRVCCLCCNTLNLREETGQEDKCVQGVVHKLRGGETHTRVRDQSSVIDYAVGMMRV